MSRWRDSNTHPKQAHQSHVHANDGGRAEGLRVLPRDLSSTLENAF